MTWQEEYKKLWLADKLKRFPEFYKSCSNPVDYLKIPREKSANGLTQLIIRFLIWKGHYANRISTQGQARVDQVRGRTTFDGRPIMQDVIKWTPGSTKRGTPDIAAIIDSKAVWIEVKFGKDRMSDDQLKQMEHIVDAGGIYYIARTMDGFYGWYYKTFVFQDPDYYTEMA